MRIGATRARDEQLPYRALAVAPVGAGGKAYAGADAQGCFTLAIATVSHGPSPVPVRMAEIEVEFGVRYLLDQQGACEDVRVTVLRCNSGDSEVRALFGSFADSLLEALPSDPREGDVAAELDKWIGLFWRLQAPARTDVVGLIGELALLRVAPNCSEWVRSWHGDPTSTIDFVHSDPPVEVEVKATQAATRTHTISGDQAFGPGERYFASTFVDLRDTGGTIGDFVRQIVDRIDRADDRRRFWNVLAAECGSSFAEFMAERFVWQRSVASIAFFSRADLTLPEVVYPVPAAVTGLRFRSDFSDSRSMSPGEFFNSIDRPSTVG